MEAEEAFTTVVLGGVGIGKTYNNVLSAMIYAKPNPKTGKQGRKVIILNFQNEDGYDKFRRLPPTKEGITKFVNQKTIEVRQINAVDTDGSIMNSTRKVEVMKLVLQYFRNGLAIFDDIDAYATHGSSSDKDLIGMLMGLRHKGCHTLFAHQAWRKMGVAEVENLRYIRLHKAMDKPSSLPKEKLETLDIHMCWIAYYLVEAQYDLANRLKAKGELNEQQWLKAKSYHIYIDRLTKKISSGAAPIKEHNFQLAVRRYCSQDRRVIDEEIKEMIFEEICTHKDKNNPTIRAQALQRLITRFKNMYLK